MPGAFTGSVEIVVVNCKLNIGGLINISADKVVESFFFFLKRVICGADLLSRVFDGGGEIARRVSYEVGGVLNLHEDFCSDIGNRAAAFRADINGIIAGF